MNNENVSSKIKNIINSINHDAEKRIEGIRQEAILRTQKVLENSEICEDCYNYFMKHFTDTIGEYERTSNDEFTIHHVSQPYTYKVDTEVSLDHDGFPKMTFTVSLKSKSNNFDYTVGSFRFRKQSRMDWSIKKLVTDDKLTFDRTDKSDDNSKLISLFMNYYETEAYTEMAPEIIATEGYRQFAQITLNMVKLNIKLTDDNEWNQFCIFHRLSDGTEYPAFYNNVLMEPIFRLSYRNPYAKYIDPLSDKTGISELILRMRICQAALIVKEQYPLLFKYFHDPSFKQEWCDLVSDAIRLKMHEEQLIISGFSGSIPDPSDKWEL